MHLLTKFLHYNALPVPMLRQVRRLADLYFSVFEVLLRSHFLGVFLEFPGDHFLVILVPQGVEMEVFGLHFRHFLETFEVPSGKV